MGTHATIMAVVVCGVTVASHSNAEFNLAGFALQLLATASEGGKLVLVQSVSNKSLKLDPLTTVYNYAPIACVLLACSSAVFEGLMVLRYISCAWHVLFLNCLAAVILNVLIVGAVKHSSAVAFILAGLAKDIATITASVVAFGSIVGLSQVLGFLLSLVGILMYKVYRQNLTLFLKLGLLGGFSAVLANVGNCSVTHEGPADGASSTREGPPSRKAARSGATRALQRIRFPLRQAHDSRSWRLT